MGFALFLFLASAFGILAVFLLYPVVLFFWPRTRAEEAPPEGGPPARVSVLIAVRNGERLIREKLENSLALDWPHADLEVLIASDGSSDATNAIVASCEDPRVRLVASQEHIGKAAALNLAIEAASGELLLFTDADALLVPNALRLLARHFLDPAVGGVCGQRTVGTQGVFLESAQQGYISLDSWLKVLEARVGSLTSNDGKVHCIRKEGCPKIPDGVNDDLYLCFSTVQRGKRFVFEPEALAVVQVPSRSALHELARRRRITARSLQTLRLRRGLFHPLRFGIYALGIAVNRLGRRLLPFFLLTLLASNVALATRYPLMLALLGLQSSFYLLALLHPLLTRFKRLGPVLRLTGMAHYFLLGNVGTFLGVFDFLMGRNVTRWEPLKGRTGA